MTLRARRLRRHAAAGDCRHGARALAGPSVSRRDRSACCEPGAPGSLRRCRARRLSCASSPSRNECRMQSCGRRTMTNTPFRRAHRKTWAGNGTTPVNRGAGTPTDTPPCPSTQTSNCRSTRPLSRQDPLACLLSHHSSPRFGVAACATSTCRSTRISPSAPGLRFRYIARRSQRAGPVFAAADNFRTRCLM